MRAPSITLSNGILYQRHFADNALTALGWLTTGSWATDVWIFVARACTSSRVSHLVLYI